jgi:hypothetical protein
MTQYNKEHTKITVEHTAEKKKLQYKITQNENPNPTTSIKTQNRNHIINIHKLSRDENIRQADISALIF